MKRYPFSCEKHAHDIEFLYNRTFCVKHDMEVGTIPMDDSEYDRLILRLDALSELLVAVLSTRDSRGIAWLDGPQIGLAKEAVLWAAETRAATKYAHEHPVCYSLGEDGAQ